MTEQKDVNEKTNKYGVPLEDDKAVMKQLKQKREREYWESVKNLLEQPANSQKKSLFERLINRIRTL